MFKWFDLLSFRSPEEISSLKKEIDNGANPRDAKILLAFELAERFTNNDEAMQAQENFSKNLQRMNYLQILKSKLIRLTKCQHYQIY